MTYIFNALTLFAGGFFHSNPMNLVCPGLAKFLVFLQILSGVLISCIGLWLVIWAPHTRIQDNPYWSGLMLVFAGAIAMILLDFRRSPRQRVRETVFRVLRINSHLLTVVAGCLAVVACVFAMLHFMNLTDVDRDCRPAIRFTIASECVCVFGSTTTDHKYIEEFTSESPIDGHEFLYKDLSCMEVRDAWRYILLASAICNLIGAVAVLFYLVLIYFKKTKQKYPASVIRSNNLI